MIKTNLLLVVLASAFAFAFAGCSKDERAPEEAPKTAEPTSGDTAVVDEPATDEPATTDPTTDPTTAEPAEPAGEVPPTAPIGATGDMTREQIAEQSVAMFTKLNEVVKTGKNDCEKIASEFTTVINEYKPVLAAAKKLDEDPENKKWFAENYGEKVTVIYSEMMSNMSECMQDPAILKAFEGMEE